MLRWKSSPSQTLGRLRLQRHSHIVNAPQTLHRQRLSSCNAVEEDMLPRDEESAHVIKYPIVAALASTGAAETAYLTFVKLFDTPLVCPTSGCESILSSEYSEIFGIPLSLLGMLTYIGVATVAMKASSLGQTVGEDTRTLDSVLVGGISLLVSCSAGLMYILATKFSGEACPWCFLSAGISLLLMLMVAWGMGSERLRSAAAPGAGALLAGISALYFGFGNVGSSNAGISEIPYYKPDVTTESSNQAIALVGKLQKGGAKMYGAFWCSHCFEQKQTFGMEAASKFPYVECFPDGWKRGAPLADDCKAAGVRAFPTWVINGRLVEGELTLDALQLELDTPAGQPSPNAVSEEENQGAQL